MQFKPQMSNSSIVDGCGIERPVRLLDNAWICSPGKMDLELANGSAHAVIVIPPLKEFMDATLIFSVVCGRMPKAAGLGQEV